MIWYTVFDSSTGDIIKSGCVPREDAAYLQSVAGHPVILHRSDDAVDRVDLSTMTVVPK